MEALKEIQLRFYKDFPPHSMESVYGFATPSTMKPTQWSCKFCVRPHYIWEHHGSLMEARTEASVYDFD